MSPLVWDLAHIGHYEELWLLRKLAGAPATDPHFDDVYDAFKHPRRDRPALRILDPDGARRSSPTCANASSTCSPTRTSTAGDPLLAHGFVYGMVVQHEHQHDETMLATIQLMETARAPGVVRDDADTTGTTVASAPDELAMPGGAFVMGTDAEPWAYDNERPAHEVEVAPFRIDRTPVTNAAYLEFVADGGYDDPRLWTDDGWAWRMEADLAHPQFWRREGAGDWSSLRYGRRLDLPGSRPSPSSTCAGTRPTRTPRWRGARLPTEAEWEYAASWGPDARKRRYPWGDTDPDDSLANLGQTRDGPVATGTRPRWRERVRASSRWSATSGSGPRPTSTRTPGSARSRTASTPRSSSDAGRRECRAVQPAERGVQGAARRLVGDPPERAAHDVPQLGLPDPPPDLHRLPLRADA